MTIYDGKRDSVARKKKKQQYYSCLAETRATRKNREGERIGNHEISRVSSLKTRRVDFGNPTPATGVLGYTVTRVSHRGARFLRRGTKPEPITTGRGRYAVFSDKDSATRALAQSAGFRVIDRFWTVWIPVAPAKEGAREITRSPVGIREDRSVLAEKVCAGVALRGFIVGCSEKCVVDLSETNDKYSDWTFSTRFM